MSDAAFKSAPYAGYITNELREWLRRPHSGMTEEVTVRVYHEVERREKVAAGDVSVMTDGECLRYAKKN